MEQSVFKLVQNELNLPSQTVKAVITLLSEGATVPFIARYRKEKTNGLDEQAIFEIQKAKSKAEALIKRKETILKSMETQGLLTDKIKTDLTNIWSLDELEDFYLPFKKKQKTKASVARENGLEPLAKIIMSQREHDLNGRARRFINKNVPNIDAALEGARNIIAEWINENAKTRNILRQAYERFGSLTSKVVKKKIEEAQKYKDYFDYSSSLRKTPSHRILAIFRAENEGFLRVKIELDNDSTIENIRKFYVRDVYSECGKQISQALDDATKRLLFPSLENEFKKKAKEKADIEAIDVFSKNLEDLLFAAPLGSKRILALDPGFRTGCKLAILDENGSLIYDTAIFPHPPHSQKEESRLTLQHLVEKYNIEAISIGNGTAGKETYKFVKEISLKNSPDLFFTNESGASIYSASEVARAEFPHKDITVRGAVSIGRRLMDPLAELVKIDPKSIGVGQYQHDVNQTLLRESLDNTVSKCVNKVGVDLNTASKELLIHVAGLGPVLAQNIIDYRSESGGFTEKKQLNKVKRMGTKAFEQSAGFLRIKNGTNPLDNTAVHPERYSLVNEMAKDINTPIDNLINNPTLINSIRLESYIDDEVGMPTLKDIIESLQKPGLDPRGKASAFSFSDKINTINDLQIGMILPGIVNNLTKFGAFVDIGIKESGLVHISQITIKFITDPAEILNINQKVEVKVLNIDLKQNRISLTMKGL